MMTEKLRIDILLGTYNGERFLPELLNSILDQSNRNWRILARDDDSTDGTRIILDRYAAEHPSLIRIIPDPSGNLGVTRNFGTLAALSDANYVMFCDQDDIWLPDKVQCAVETMIEMERRYGAKTPLMAHGDLAVVDESLHVMHPSFMSFRRMDPSSTGQLNRLVVENVITGCTMIMNRSLKELGLPIPNEALMHDWWFALVAAAFGRSHWMPERKILYRQHETNVTNARASTLLETIRKVALTSTESFSRERRRMRQTVHQAQYFLTRYGALLSEGDRQLLTEYSRIPALGPLGRRLVIARLGAWHGSWIRNLGLLLFI